MDTLQESKQMVLNGPETDLSAISPAERVRQFTKEFQRLQLELEAAKREVKRLALLNMTYVGQVTRLTRENRDLENDLKEVVLPRPVPSDVAELQREVNTWRLKSQTNQDQLGALTRRNEHLERDKVVFQCFLGASGTLREFLAFEGMVGTSKENESDAWRELWNEKYAVMYHEQMSGRTPEVQKPTDRRPFADRALLEVFEIASLYFNAHDLTAVRQINELLSFYINESDSESKLKYVAPAAHAVTELVSMLVDLKSGLDCVDAKEHTGNKDSIFYKQ